MQRDNPDELTRGVAHAAVMELYSYDSRALQWRTDPIYESWNSLEATRKAFSEVLLTYVQEQDTGTVTTKTRDETQRRMGAFESEARRYQTECKKRLQALDKNVAR